MIEEAATSGLMESEKNRTEFLGRSTRCDLHPQLGIIASAFTLHVGTKFRTRCGASESTVQCNVKPNDLARFPYSEKEM
jgi:hypothetical protein